MIYFNNKHRLRYIFGALILLIVATIAIYYYGNNSTKKQLNDIYEDADSRSVEDALFLILSFDPNNKNNISILNCGFWKDGCCIWSEYNEQNELIYRKGKFAVPELKSQLDSFFKNSMSKMPILETQHVLLHHPVKMIKFNYGDHEYHLYSSHETFYDSDKVLFTESGLSPIKNSDNASLLSLYSKEWLCYLYMWDHLHRVAYQLLPRTGKLVNWSLETQR